MEADVKLRFVRLGAELKLLITEAMVNGQAVTEVPIEPLTIEKKRVFFIRVVARREGERVVVRDEPVFA